MLETKVKAAYKKEKKLKAVVSRLEEQNTSIFTNTDNAVKDFQDHIVKL